MVHVIANEWQQVPKSALNLVDPPGDLRQPRGKVGEPLRFKLLVVHDNAAMITERIAQRQDERRAGIARVRR